MLSDPFNWALLVSIMGWGFMLGSLFMHINGWDPWHGSEEFRGTICLFSFIGAALVLAGSVLLFFIDEERFLAHGYVYGMSVIGSWWTVVSVRDSIWFNNARSFCGWYFSGIAFLAVLSFVLSRIF